MGIQFDVFDDKGLRKQSYSQIRSYRLLGDEYSMKLISIKDFKYFVPFAMPILFFAVLMDWSIDGIEDIVFGIIPLIFFRRCPIFS